jgi:hypothetical protein
MEFTRKEALVAIGTGIELTVARINAAETVGDLSAHIGDLRKLHVARDQHLFGRESISNSSDMLDTEILSQHLLDVVTLFRESKELSEANIEARVGIATDRLRLVLYYLRVFGNITKVGRGKKAVFTWVTDQIAPGLVQANWASIQPRY